MAQQKIFINGRFLQKPITGTERFAREIVWAMDDLLSEQDSRPNVTIMAPAGTPHPEGLKVIGFEICGTLQGHAWEQWDLFRATRNGVLLSLTNSGPVLHSRQIVVIHDAAPYRLAEDYSFAYRTLHKTLGYVLARRSHIATVSEFSRADLADVLKISAEHISVVNNGHEHILRGKADDSILGKLNLTDRPYFLFVGSPVPRKNLNTAIRAFESLARSDIAFVMVGAANAKIFKESQGAQSRNIILPGRLSDEEIVSLYRHAMALVFPSIYEGFGIPPLEAMVYGCPVLASDIPPVKEVCVDAASYFNPLDVSDCARCMKEFLENPEAAVIMTAKGKNRCKDFSWKTGAREMLAFVDGQQQNLRDAA